MAYSSVRVQFEIGHEASVRTKKTPEGFTHDWEVFVRGADSTDIQYFVDKVVFHLHETFPKPKRVIKDPPYVVKESGYAGFVLPIDVYLKNKEEPKKISFQYDLTLQSSGPPISRVLREPRLFQNPSEDFRRKLIRGGGVGVDTPSEPPSDDLKSASSVPPSKTKPVDSPIKKHKSDQPLNHSFAELFGTPIRRMPDAKKLPDAHKKIEDKKKTSKPYKEEKDVSKEKYSERDKSKEKPKRVPSPSPSPSLPPPALALQVKSKEEHKKHEEKEKKKEEEKKKRKEEKREKAKEPERQLEKERKKEKKEGREGEYAKKLNSKPPDPKSNYEKHNNECADKEKEKHKHRHKKKEKEKSRDKERHRKEKEKEFRDREKDRGSKKKHEESREKEEKRRKSRSPSPVQVKKGPLNALLDELGSSDSVSPLSEEESIPQVKSLPKAPAKPVPEVKAQPLVCVPSKPKSTNANESGLKLEEGNLNKNKKEKSSSKKGKKSEKESEKKKEKDDQRARSLSSERAEREEDEERERGNKDERIEKDRLEEERQKAKDKENRKRRREKSEEKQVKCKKNEGSQSGAAEGPDGTADELRRPDKFTKEYVAQLRDLQHRIMTLEDNAELQKVVKVIAETGQYEVTKKTFDFDLCALDMETVKRLQEFFAPT